MTAPVPDQPMHRIREALDDAKQELADFLALVELLEGIRDGEMNGTVSLPAADENLKVMKSAARLMLYNMLEATVRTTVLEAYSRMRSEGLPYRAVSGPLRDLWLRSRMIPLRADDANMTTALNVLRESVELVLSPESGIVLDAEKLNFGGNLDARAIRRLCKDHGVSEPRGGEKLVSIKDDRNALAHGSKTFQEAGRDMDLAALRDDLEHVSRYLHDFVDHWEDFVVRRLYRDDDAAS